MENHKIRKILSNIYKYAHSSANSSKAKPPKNKSKSNLKLIPSITSQKTHFQIVFNKNLFVYCFWAALMKLISSQ